MTIVDLRRWLLPLLALPLTACATTEPPIPAIQEVLVPVPVACEIQQVPPPELPSAKARKGMDIWQLAQIALAERRVMMADAARLRAANQTPCPATSPTE
jgi:hypothetical protein